jgi:hypothetical protein
VVKDQESLLSAGPSSDGSSTFDQDRKSENNAQAVEHNFIVIAFDRRTGKKLWENVAKVATPHEGHNPTLSSFANSSPVVDAKHVIAPSGPAASIATCMMESRFGKKILG